MDIKLIAADLDGTLLDSQKRLSPGFPDLLRDLRMRGIRFAPASGRQYYNILALFGDENMTYIAENGAMVFENGRCLFADTLPRELQRQTIEMVRALPDAYVILAGEQSAWCEADEPVFYRNAEMYYARLTRVHDLMQVEDRICKIAVFQYQNAENSCLPALKVLSEQAQVVLSGADWVDLMNPGVNKGGAIRRLYKELGISPNECMAFGDYLNDCEMLQSVTHSFAMANAHPEIKAICRYQAPSNDEDGVVRAIREFCGLPVL